MKLNEIEHHIEPILQNTSGTIIILFANSAYREIIINWISAAKKLDVHNFWIISLDKPLDQELRKLGVNSVCCELSTKLLSRLWIFRIAIFKKLLTNNIDFVHSDADAVWLKNPLISFGNTAKKFDLLASQGTIWPLDVFEQWRFVLCCGFFWARATKNTKNLFHELSQDIMESGDDQSSLNRVLYRRGLKWTFPGEKNTILFKDRKLSISSEIMYGVGENINIGLIPFREVQRIPLKQFKPTIAHPISPKESAKKKSMFKKLDIWFAD